MKKLLWAFRYRKAVRKADKAAKDYGTTFMVLLYGGKLKVASRTALKQLIKDHKFRKGTTIRDIDRIALYVAK